MLPTARVENEQDLFPGGAPPPIVITRGVVGWNNESDHAEIGTASTGDVNFKDPSLVRVTLHQGREQSQKPVDGKAHGIQILCQVMGPLYWIPPVGTSILVGFPDNDMSAPGAGVILGSIGKSPGIQFGKPSAKMDFGPDQTVTIKAKQIILSTYDNSYLAIGSAFGIMLNDKKGSGFQINGTKLTFYSAFLGDAKSVLELDINKASLIVKDQGFIKIADGKLNTFANVANLTAGATFIGNPGSPGGGPAAINIAGAAISTSVFITI